MGENRQHAEELATLRAELEHVRAEHARLRQLVDLSPDVMYSVDGDGRLIFANRRLEELYGQTPGSLVGRTLAEFDPDPEQGARYIETIREIIRSGRGAASVDTFQDPGVGVERTFEFRDLPYEDVETGLPCVMGVATEITERLRLERDRAERQRLERDLDIARQIQRSLLPKAQPELEAFEIAGWSEAADHTGGDYYDWMPLADGRVLVSIADVSGHGIGPALVTAFCRAYARAVMRETAPLASLVARLNDLLVEDLPEDRFITFAAGVLDPRTRRLEFVSAGHGPSVHHRARAGQTQMWSANGAPLAIIDHATYDEPIVAEFEPGDTLLLVSDGFFECANPAGERFGTERLGRAVARHAPRGAGGLIEALREEVVAFSSGVAQADDMTAVAVHCRS